MNLSQAIYKIRSIGLKWKLLLPFLFFSFVGTTVLVYVGLISQQNLIRKEERGAAVNFYRIFLEIIDQKKQQALSLATVIGSDPAVRELLAERDHVGLLETLRPLYDKLRENFEIEQFHFHVPPGKSFLRLHMPEERGEMLAYRKGVVDAMRTGAGVAGLEWGVSGLGIRGISPIFHQGRLAGSVEIGFPFDRRFVDDLKRGWGPDFAVYEKRGEEIYVLLATTFPHQREFNPYTYLARSDTPLPLILISPESRPEKTVLLGPVFDSFGEMAALVEVSVDRSGIIGKLAAIRNLMVLVGLAGLFLSFSLTWLVASLFIRPIKEIVLEAQEIAEEKREIGIDPMPMDEIGNLAYSLNLMLDALKRKQRRIEEYARTLELRVKERTRDLVASEEKYRELVENLPLIVYRVLSDGTTEFINSQFSKILGYDADDVVGDRQFWATTVCGHAGGAPAGVVACCWGGSEDFRMERSVKDIRGKAHTFMDRAIPRRDKQGEIKWIDGIMMDISELKRLQERALRTEEVKILGEISARFAHELRNPLTTAGGFAGRLASSLSEEHPGKEAARIIVAEVARLEEILQIILSTIEPVVLHTAPLDAAALVRVCLDDVAEEAEGRGVRIVESLPPDLLRIEGDEAQLQRAFNALLRHAVLSMPEGERLTIRASQDHAAIVVTLAHRMEGFSDDDLEQFFMPRFSGKPGRAVLDLPLSKVIIHRHGGKIDVSYEGDRLLTLRIELPGIAR
ncbi:MAG: PAS domain S-box protein [Deltaproteobacteria bacterium]|nr:PAS domain S-box protein [Deltaproteobacteria bacterium]